MAEVHPEQSQGEHVFTMPSLGADMEDGTLVEWLVKPGDVVHRGQVVAVVETQKGAIEVEIWQDGTVSSIEVPVGSTVPVGSVLAHLTQPLPLPLPLPLPVPEQRHEPPPSPTPAPTATPAPVPAPVAGLGGTAGPASGGGTGWIRSAPSARRRAHELGIDLAQVPGTGPHGAVTRADVEHYHPPGPVPPGPVPPEPEPAPAPVAPTRPAAAGPRPEARLAMRQAIAAAMERSNREIPHYYLSHHVDVKTALDHVARLDRERPIERRLLPMALFVSAVARALAAHPALNGTWVDGAFRPATGVHPGIAIALRGGGLVIPAIHDADRKDVDAVMADLADLTTRARAGRLRSSELADGTVTVTGLGEQGVEAVFGVIYPPQVALIGIGKVVERPWAVDGMLAVRPVLQLTLAADHRATDGHVGALFLAQIERLLAAPEAL